MDNKKLIMIGGGGHCKSVIDVAESAGYEIMGVLDPNMEVGSRVLGYEVLGGDELIKEYAERAEFVITVGQMRSCAVRRRLAESVERAGGRFATVVAADAYVSRYAAVGEGTVVMHKAMVNAAARVGRNCIVNTMANIEHDAEVGDFCHISTGVMVNGEAKVGCECFVGSGSVVYNCTSICDGTVVAAGSVVSRRIKVAGIYAGNPAKHIIL